MARNIAASDKEFEIVGLIDIIFLLIVFGIAMATFVGESKKNRAPSTIPELNNLLTFVIQPELNPEPDQLPRSTLLIENAPFDVKNLEFFMTDQQMILISKNTFANSEACALIQNCIDRYALELQNIDNNLSQTIRIEAHPDTKMRIISFVFEACAKHFPKMLHVDIMSIDRRALVN